MPKHAFRFPPEVISSVKRHVRKAIDAVPPQGYRQEPNYNAALANRLAGTAYEGEHGSVVFRSTAFDDRAPSSAEHRSGADYAITAIVSDGRLTIAKTIMVQSKLGRVSELSDEEREHLKIQIRKMKRLVNAPKVMEVPELDGIRFPQIISGNNILQDSPYTPMSLSDYFVARVTTTLDGCTDPWVIATVQDSSLPTVHVSAVIE
jgi:hypothetical protein